MKMSLIFSTKRLLRAHLVLILCSTFGISISSAFSPARSCSGDADIIKYSDRNARGIRDRSRETGVVPFAQMNSLALFATHNDNDKSVGKSNDDSHLDTNARQSERSPGTTKGDIEDKTENNADTVRNNSEDAKATAKRPPSTTRIGGRSNSFSNFISRPPVKSESNNNLSNITKVLLPIVFILWLLKSLLGGLFAPPPPASNFVYYQSSSYESRIIDGDGNIKTTRKESMRSNIPSLMATPQQQQQNSGSIRRYVQESNVPDADFTREIDSEVAESMREAREMIRGMGFSDFSSLDRY